MRGGLSPSYWFLFIFKLPAVRALCAITGRLDSYYNVLNKTAGSC